MSAETHELERLLIRIEGDMSPYKRMLADLTRDTAAASSAVAASTSSITKKASMMARAVSESMADAGRQMRQIGGMATIGMTAPLVGAGIAAIKLASDLETVTTQYQVMLGRSAGNKMLADLREFAKATPFRFEQVSSGAKTLMAFGVAAEDVLPTMQMIGDVAAGAGSDFQSLATVFGQIKGMGKLQGQDFLQLVNSAPPVVKALSDMYGGTAKLREAMEKGDVPFAAVEEAFRRLTSNGGQLNNMMKMLSKTSAGAFSNLMDDFIMTAQAFGMQLLPMAKDAIAWLGEMVNQFKALDPLVKNQIIVAAGLVAALGPVIWAFGAIATMVSFATSAQFLWVAAGIAVVATALAITDALGMTNTGFGDLFNSIRINGTGLATWFAGIAIEFKKMGYNILYSFTFVWNGLKAAGYAVADVILGRFKYIADGILQLNNLLPKSVRFDLTGTEEFSRGLAIESQKRAAEIMAGERELADILRKRDLLDNKTKKLFMNDPQTNGGFFEFDADKAGKAADKMKDGMMGAIGDLLSWVSGYIPKAAELPGIGNAPPVAGGKWDGAVAKTSKAEEQKIADFKQVSLNRISVEGLSAGARQKKQDVRAQGVEDRLDKLIEVTGTSPVLV